MTGGVFTALNSACFWTPLQDEPPKYSIPFEMMSVLGLSFCAHSGEMVKAIAA